MADRGDVAVSVDHQRLRDLDRKTRLHQTVFIVPVSSSATRRFDFGNRPTTRPKVQSLPDECSAFFCHNCDGPNSIVLVSLLQLYQIVHRTLTRFTRGSTKLADVQFARLEARKDLPRIQSRTLSAGARESICKTGALVGSVLYDIAWSPTRTRHSG